MRKQMLLAASAAPLIFGTLLVAGCGMSSTTPGSAYSTGVTDTMSSQVPPSAASSPFPAVLTVRKTRIGYVLANAQGFTLYWFARDPRGGSRPACAGRCLMVWFPLTGDPVAAKGIMLHAMLGTIPRAGGSVQVTYNGYPLYTFGSDDAPGQIRGNGVAGAWHVIRESAPSR